MKYLLALGVLLIQGCVSIERVQEYEGRDKASVTLTGVWSAVGLFQDSGKCHTRKIMPDGKRIRKKGNKVIPESTTIYYEPDSIVMYSLDRMYLTSFTGSKSTSVSCGYTLAFKPVANEKYTIDFDMGYEDCQLEVTDSKGKSPSEIYIADNIYDVAGRFGVVMCSDYLNGGLEQ